jgi:hypothetical protein
MLKLRGLSARQTPKDREGLEHLFLRSNGAFGECTLQYLQHYLPGLLGLLI